MLCLMVKCIVRTGNYETIIMKLRIIMLIILVFVVAAVVDDVLFFVVFVCSFFPFC